MSNRKKKKKESKKPHLSRQILQALLSEPSKPLNYKQLAAKMGVDDPGSRNQITQKLKKLVESGQVEQPQRGKYRASKTEIDREKNRLASSEGDQAGVLDINRRGHGYVLVDGLEDDIFIHNRNLNRALNGDTVAVKTFRRRNRGGLEGEVLRVLKRSKTDFVGVIRINKGSAFLEPEDNRMYTDIYIPSSKTGDARDGDKVAVRIDDWPAGAKSPVGIVTKVFGTPGEHQAEIHAILAQYGFPEEFPQEVTDFANSIDTGLNPKEIARRRDMRNTLTLTIDPADAKDFDDALSFRVLENGNYEIGIHIADVTHYMKPGTVLDREAYQRATSVYLVDRVVPMLPEVLSNGVCSLRPNEEKYTFSTVFEMDKNARIKNRWFGRTVTLSRWRFTYAEAQHIIETGQAQIPGDISLTEKTYEVDGEVVEAISGLNHIARILRKDRMRNGSVSFDKVETKFELDGDNNPVGVFFKETKEANHLIEEYMLLSNKKVAELFGKNDPPLPFVYRIHDDPDPEKLAELERISNQFGYRVNFKQKNINDSLNKLLNDVKGAKEQQLIDTLAIRSMSKAVYSPENIGHYGLAFDYYTHFTSPIRRYPDVMVHRLLEKYLDSKKTGQADAAECRHCSQMENMASKAERDSIKYMQVKYMQDHQDKTFLGAISGVTDWGIFVEILENHCEGLVNLRDLDDDHYEFDVKEFAVTGRRTKNTYQLGDLVYVKVKNTDLIKKQLDFWMVGKKEER